MKVLLVAITAAVACARALAAESTNTEHEAAAKISLEAVVVVAAKDKFWSLDELNNVALAKLVERGDIQKGAKLRTIVHITPSEKKTLCEFLYLQHFGQPFWRVKFGYDGKIKSIERKRQREGPGD